MGTGLFTQHMIDSPVSQLVGNKLKALPVPGVRLCRGIAMVGRDQIVCIAGFWNADGLRPWMMQSRTGYTKVADRSRAMAHLRMMNKDKDEVDNAYEMQEIEERRRLLDCTGWLIAKE